MEYEVEARKQILDGWNRWNAARLELFWVMGEPLPLDVWNWDWDIVVVMGNIYKGV